jgi:hypothetical protein
MLSLSHLRVRQSQKFLLLQHQVLCRESLVQVITHLQQIRAWVSHAQWQDQVTTHLRQTKVWVAQVRLDHVQEVLDLLVPEPHLQDRVVLDLLELEDHQDQVRLVQLELELEHQVEHQDLADLVEDQALVAVVAVAELPVHLVRVVLETHLRQESQRERNAKNLNYVQRQALVEQLFHAVTEAL